LAQFARFTAVIGQLRGLQRESLAALREAGEAEPAQRELLLQRAQGLENQSDRVLAHVATLRNALVFLVGGVLLMVLCSLAIGASIVIVVFGAVALALFVLGLVSTLAGLTLVLSELRVSLEAIEFEHENVSRLRRGEGLLPSDH
jgi:VIT1/CCC1 family predicted Fe2+/Mn2+ transporter